MENEVFDNVKSEKRIIRDASYYDVDLNGDVVNYLRSEFG